MIGLKELGGINLNHLFYFHAVAREGSITAASRTLGVAPSTLSEQIRELESSLGAQLFTRSSRSLSLNDAGRLVHEQTEVMLQAAERVWRQFVPEDRRSQPLLRVGYSSSIARAQIAWDLTPLFSVQGARVNMQTADTGQLVQTLLRGELDLIIADQTAPESLSGSLSSHALPGSPLVTVVSQDVLERTGGEALRTLPILHYSVTSRFRWDVEQWLKARGLEPEVLGEVDDVGLMIAVARAGKCFAVIPQASLMDSGMGLSIVERLEAACDRYAIHQGGSPTELVNQAVSLLEGIAARHNGGRSEAATVREPELSH
jgi:LysR family transcriptional regulator, transcriptional activator of nhaA